MSAGVCGACHRMCDEKQSVKCIGSCAAHYHLSCAKIDTTEREFFIVDGVSVYKCHNCTRRGNNDMCVTPIISQQKGKAAEDKCVKNNFECLVVKILNGLKENNVSVLHHLKEISNQIGKISADLRMLRTENEALKYMLPEYFKQNEACVSMKPNNANSLSKCIQSSSESGTDTCTGEPSQSTLAAEDISFKIVHKRIRNQRPEFPSPISTSAEEICKMEARSKSGVSTSAVNPKMKALPEIKADEVKELLEFYGWKCYLGLLYFVLLHTKPWYLVILEKFLLNCSWNTLLLWNRKNYYCIQKNPPLEHILRQLNSNPP